MNSVPLLNRRRITSFANLFPGAARKFPGTLLVAFVIALALCVPNAFAQTNISGDIAGVVTDPTGAAIAGAQVTVTSQATGQVQSVTSGDRGQYRVPLLSPGDYTITVTAPKFSTATETITVTQSTIADGDVMLPIGQATTTVDVTAAQPLLHTTEAQISTSFTMQQVQSLPNPGNDLTFVAQTAPGAVMNTQMGYGNFSMFGLPATSNTFTVNGGYYNDPFLNLNNSGATNLLLGNNDIAEVTVVSNAYDAAFGGLGGAQINEISRSGSNAIHGNASYWWNGRAMNANDWFNKNQGSPRPFDNVNQWAGALGGPIIKDKLFWFFNTEGIRIIIPTRSQIYTPSPGYQTEVTAPCNGAPDAIFPASMPFGNLACNGNSGEASFYTNNLFKAYNGANGIGGAVPVTIPGDLAPGYQTFNSQATNFTHEWLVTGRVDWVISPSDRAFVHYEYDRGFQATFTSFLTPLFNAGSTQPEQVAQFQETHIFTPNLTNQFLAAGEYYQAIFENPNGGPEANLAAPTNPANQLVPFTQVFVDSPLGSNPNGGLLGGIDEAFPQGRNVTNYQFADDLNWTKGAHNLKFGWSMRRDDVSDHDPGQLTTPLVEGFEETFAAGFTDAWIQNFPTRLSQPIALYNMGAYIQDQWKPAPNFTMTMGLRVEHNSNPTCLTNCFGYSNGDFYTLSQNTTVPLNSLIRSGLRRTFHNLQYVGWEPRIGFAYLPFGPGSKTTVRGGFGIFIDTFPATVADNLLTNVPTNIPVTLTDGNFGGAYAPLLIDPGVAGSAYSIAASAASGLAAGFAGGASSSSLGFAPSLVTQANKIKYPTYDEYSLAVEQQLTRTTALAINYVGNSGHHEPVVSNSANACGFPGLPGCIATPYSVGYNPNFGGVTIDYSGASSNYNGLIATLTNRTRYVTASLNYAYSHALDQISNGGFLGFGLNSVSPTSPYTLRYNYGNADYDTRNYISGSYVITIPYWGGPHILTDDWQVAGTVFHNTGYPFSAVDGLNAPTIPNYNGELFMQQLNGNFSDKCGGEAHAFRAANAVQTPCAFAAPGTSNATLANYAFATALGGQQERNQLRGPNYTDFDMDITKGFKIPWFAGETADLRAGAQFFNLFNHPNFQLPSSNDTGIGALGGSGTFGTSTSLQQTPTSILGAFLGGDSAPRLIQFKAVFQF
jgi:hypothetical protein